VVRALLERERETMSRELELRPSRCSVQSRREEDAVLGPNRARRSEPPMHSLLHALSVEYQQQPARLVNLPCRFTAKRRGGDHASGHGYGMPEPPRCPLAVRATVPQVATGRAG
jgi:hypothetical protein